MARRKLGEEAGWVGEDEGALRARERRLEVSELLSRTRVLEEADRALVEMVLGRGVSVAGAAAWREESESAVRRRLVRVLTRLGTAEVEWLCAVGVRGGEVSRVGRMHFGWGWSLRAIAAESGLKLHEVREECRRVSDRAAAWRGASGWREEAA